MACKISANIPVFSSNGINDASQIVFNKHAFPSP